jgi:hypothetical protein
MPVILTAEAEIETWLTAPTKDALALQRPLPDGALKIVVRGDRTGDVVDGASVMRITARSPILCYSCLGPGIAKMLAEKRIASPATTGSATASVI